VYIDNQPERGKAAASEADLPLLTMHIAGLERLNIWTALRMRKFQQI
jgi:hypothetical protein